MLARQTPPQTPLMHCSPSQHAGPAAEQVPFFSRQSRPHEPLEDSQKSKLGAQVHLKPSALLPVVPLPHSLQPSLKKKPRGQVQA